MDSRRFLVPEENIQIYQYLFMIETALREFIIECLKALEGPRWYKSRLPQDVLEKYRAARDVEKNTKWTQLVPHHPIYYVDFPDLKKIIERRDNWNDSFQATFKEPKEALVGTLVPLEFIRNKVAHNRKATGIDVEIVQASYAKLRQALGEKRFDELTERCTIAPDIRMQLLALKTEMATLSDRMIHFQTLSELWTWPTVRREWWFDESYLGAETNPIVTFFQVAHDYSLLPHSRGTGHKLETWVRDTAVELVHAGASNTVDRLLALGGD